MQDDLRPGQVIGPYELIFPVGIGGMARVWAARVRGTGQVVALKMLHAAMQENPSFQEMFFDEARIASRVNHPNVAQTYELGKFDGILTIVMEWIDGGSLMRIFRPGPETDEKRPRVPIPYRHAARILADACAGLHAAHETVDEHGRPLAVVHRDVSPHNVLITTSGEIKLTDFGVAKALNKYHVTIAGQIKGKLAYMSPEQLMGGDVDRRSDVFALGCVLYEMTTGARPFQGDHDPQVMAAIVMGNYEPPQNIRRDYPPELAAIVARALDGDAERRFPTAESLRGALEQFLRTSGPPITPQQIAILLEERIGPEIHARAMALAPPGTPRSAPRSAPLSAPASTPQMHEPGSGPGAMAVDRRGQGASSGAGMVGLIVAVLVGAGLGAAVLFYVHSSMKKSKPPPVVAIATADAAAGIPPSASTSTVADAATSAPPIVVAQADAAIEEVSLDDDLDAAVEGGADATVTVARPKPRPAPKPAASGEAPPDLPPNPFE